MTVFTSVVLQNAKNADDEGKLDEFLSNLQMLGFVPDTDEAFKMYEAAIAAEEAARIAAEHLEALADAQVLVDAFTLPKSITNLMYSLKDVLGWEDDKPWAIKIGLNEDNEPKMTLMSRSTKATSQSARKGKAMLDGIPLTAKLLRESYPTTIAGRIMINKGKPFGITKRKNGADYSPNSNFNATQAAMADAELKERITFQD